MQYDHRNDEPGPSHPDTDILIVGAGPVGLFLACECARRGLRYRLVESRAAQSIHSKALAIFPRTLEILDMAGVVTPFLEVANRVISVALMAHGRTLARMPFTPGESPYPFIAMVPQDVTEALLVAQLQRQGGSVEYDTSFVTGEAAGDLTRVTLEHRGVRSPLTTRFVVGCDGAHSAVRHWLQVPLEGGEYSDSFMLADIEVTGNLPADQLQLCPSESGPLAIFPMSATRRRIVATVARPEEGAPSLEVVRSLLAERGPSGISATAMTWSSYFRIHHRHASRLRVGSAFLAGDAAHIHSPFGGQGMNTGMHDVWNLAWKLDLVLKGLARKELLDSYATERLPVIRQVIETTDHMTRIMGTPNRLAQWLRESIIPLVSRLVPFQHAFVRRLSGLGVAYPGSPIVEGTGARFLDDSMRGGDGVRSHFLLMIGEDTDSRMRGSLERAIRPYREAVGMRRSTKPGVSLVRPDGYVAYARDEQSDPEVMTAGLREVLARQLVPARESSAVSSPIRIPA